MVFDKRFYEKQAIVNKHNYNLMQLVERHIFLKHPKLELLCYKSAKLYNFVTYHYRQAIFGHQSYFGEYEMYALCAEFDQPDYRALPPKTAQQVIKQVFQNFKRWRAAVKSYNANPDKFFGKPRLPNYKKGKDSLNIVVLTNQQAVLKKGQIHFPKKLELAPITTNVPNICQVRIVPQATCIILEVVYNQIPNQNLVKMPENNVLSLDLGIGNFVATSNNVGQMPFIVNGKVIKSFNQWYNKERAALQSFVGNKGTPNRIQKLVHYRNNWMNDKIHKISKFIVDYCIKYNIGTIVIGKNIGWKDNCVLSRKVNQHFIQIPHAKLIQKITYKAQLKLIKVVFQEESYTSKCDALSLEPIQKQEKYQGLRVKRGLFLSGIGKTINADVNGALNILRKSKVISDSFIPKTVNSGCVYRPYKVNIL
jgi:putative transposase